MSNIVKLSSAMPADFELNGLDQLVGDLLDDPKTPRAALVVFDVRNIRDEIDEDERIPTVRIRRFEPLGEVDDISDIIRQELVKRAEKRTGKTPLPLDIVEVVDETGAYDDGDIS